LERRRVANVLPVRCLLAAAAVLVAAACGAEQADNTHTPGLDGSARGLDRSPFEMAGASQNGGSTTIPGVGPTLAVPTSIDPITGEAAVLGQQPPSKGGPDPFLIEPDPQTPFTVPKRTTTTPTTSTTTTSTTLPPTTTTTTIPPTAPILKPVDQITSLCGMSDSLRSFGTLLVNPSLSVQGSVDYIRIALDRYLQVAPEPTKVHVTNVRAMILFTADTVAAADFDLKNPTVQALVQNLGSGGGDYETFRQSVLFISNYNRLVCR